MMDMTQDQLESFARAFGEGMMRAIISEHSPKPKPPVKNFSIVRHKPSGTLGIAGANGKPFLVGLSYQKAVKLLEILNTPD